MNSNPSSSGSSGALTVYLMLLCFVSQKKSLAIPPWRLPKQFVLPTLALDCVRVYRYISQSKHAFRSQFCDPTSCLLKDLGSRLHHQLASVMETSAFTGFKLLHRVWTRPRRALISGKRQLASLCIFLLQAAVVLRSRQPHAMYALVIRGNGLS